MSTSVLVTKLYIPPPRPRAVPRRRLVERLHEGVGSKLSLVSAPAGFGKTTLVSEWLAASHLQAAWVSLDEGDSDLTRFLTYVIASLQSVDEHIGEGIGDVLTLPQVPSAESILTSVLNDISMLTRQTVLVLDDYHLIDSRPVDHAIAFLLDHIPPQLHLVITTREDPQLPLARLRARGQMTELRATDLRFTADEANAFLNEVMGLDLPAPDVADLDMRTEGWIAGLQLAALSMQGRDDISAFIHAFAGDDRYIVDYLVEEVLQRQPDHVRTFLLQTAILDRLTGSLCDAVTGRDDGAAILPGLERANLFVVPLDDKRHWYRYHHLFADVLRAHAMAENPAEVALRHRRASEWFERNGLQPDAIRHALAAGEPERAARLIEMAALWILGSSQEDMLWSWLEALPDDLVRKMPVLSVYYGFASFSRAGLDAAEARFRDAERWFADPAGSIVANEAAFRALPGTIAVGRAYRAGAVGDVDGVVRYGRHALDVMPEGEDLWGGAASAVLGIGYLTTGELERAYRYFHKGKSRLEKTGYMQFQIVSVHVLADIRMAQGRLREAERIYHEALRVASEHGDPAWGTVDLLVGLGELLTERNDLDAATRSLLKSKEAGEHAGLMDTRHRWYIVMARIRAAQGEMDDALRLLDDAARLYVPGVDPDLRPVAALKAQIWLAQGRLSDAEAWARERNLSVGNPLSFLRDFEHMTLARILIARYRRERDEQVIDDAVGLLARLLEAAEAGERTGNSIQILILLALANEARGDISGAFEPLGRVLSLAEPEGYARVFVDEGMPMARLLTDAARRGIKPEYTARLLAAFGEAVLPADASPSSHGLIELLSPRELEVMRLIAQGLSNREIADHLFLALSTVKGHNREIFGKLGVQRRTEAVARARELGLL